MRPEHLQSFVSRGSWNQLHGDAEGRWYHQTDVMELLIRHPQCTVLLLWYACQKCTISVQSWANIRKKSIKGTFYKITGLCILECHERQWKVEELFQMEGDLEDTTLYCNTWFWIGSIFSHRCPLSYNGRSLQILVCWDLLLGINVGLCKMLFPHILRGSYDFSC